MNTSRRTPDQHIDRIRADQTAAQAAPSHVHSEVMREVAWMANDTHQSLHHPVVVEHAAQRASAIQLRIADVICGFAGSMRFVYIHAVAFACWMLYVETDPWPRLTLIVSLEAIFLSTFVMIGQNRQAEFHRAKADHDFTSEQQELRLNTELTREIHTLTTELHRHVLRQPAPTVPTVD